MAKKKEIKTKNSDIQCDYRVKLYEDGKYHWMYDLNMLKNPAVLIDVFKVFGITLLIMGCFLFIIQACENGIHVEELGFVLMLMGFIAGILVVLVLLGYLLYAAMSGWTYTVHFIMDENGVVHEQSPKAKKVGERIGFLTMLAGLLARKPGVMGSGMLAASRTTMTTDFSKVRKVKTIRWMNTIKVNEPFGKNRVYVADDDFDFVYNYISSRCPKAKE